MKPLRGFALVSAIFILVVLAALGAFILNISSSQQIGSALDVQGARAYQAARAGIEWGLYQVQSTPAYQFGHASTNANLRACPVSPIPDFQVFEFAVHVECSRSPVDDSIANNPNNSPAVYSLTSTACSQAPCPNTTNPSALYVERRMTVTF